MCKSFISDISKVATLNSRWIYGFASYKQACGFNVFFLSWMKMTEKMTSPMLMRLALLVFVYSQACLTAHVDVSMRELMVLPGQNATFMCRVSVPLQYCRVEIPGLGVFNLNKKLSTKDVVYYGEGLEAGQCGFIINRVREENNGQVKCSLGLETESSESVGKMELIVARAPKDPELDISRGTDSLRVYKINDILHASCIVRDGRPVANISWYLDDEPILGTHMPTVIDLAKENLQSKIQNISRQLQASDNGKHLRCVASHPAYPSGTRQTQRLLDIKYAPLPQDTIDKFGYTIGQTGIIKVEIEANPKPQLEWTIDGQRIKEGGNDLTGRIEAETARDLGRGRYEAVLKIARIQKEDTEKEYILTAYNNMGNQNYRIKISTSPEPEGLELGIGAIIGIVVALLLVILVVAMLIFAKATDRWCFSGGATVIDYTSNDNSHNPHDGDGVDNPHHQASQEYINGNDLPIKKDEKINTAV